MAGDKSNLQKAPSSEHEAVLTGVMALANLYSNCVEAFGLIHPNQKWEKEEQLLLCRLGLQQARLLTWGDTVGISSPPASVTDRAIPRHPSAAYPDLKEPTFFGARDARLDETEIRQKVEDALSDIVDRSAHTSREEMMAKYGLKPPKKFSSVTHASTLDTNRLEGFRERYELLKEVAETYAQISSRRNSSLTQTSWNIADHGKFDTFIKLTQEKVEFLIKLMDVKDAVDRAVRMDIKALGWHLSVDRQRIAQDISKLRMIAESCKDEYPEYIEATQQALANIERERRENVVGYNPYASLSVAPLNVPSTEQTARRGSLPGMQTHQPNGSTNGNSAANAAKEKRPSLLGGFFKSFGHGRKSSHDSAATAGRSQSVSHAPTSPLHPPEDTPRSLSDVGPVRAASTDSAEVAQPKPERPNTADGAVQAQQDENDNNKLRSKSVGDILDAPTEDEHEEMLKQKLERLETNATVHEPLEDSEPVGSAISRHDQVCCLHLRPGEVWMCCLLMRGSIMVWRGRGRSRIGERRDVVKSEEGQD